jgi:hypothetical protein
MAHFLNIARETKRKVGFLRVARMHIPALLSGFSILCTPISSISAVDNIEALYTATAKNKQAVA